MSQLIHNNMSIIKYHTIVLLISLLGLQCVNSQVWDLTDIENADNLLSSWLTYGRQIYYQYQLEVDTLFCVINGIWKIARDHIIEQSRLNSETSTSKAIEGLNMSELIENDDVTHVKTPQSKRSVEKALSVERRAGGSGLASLLGITGKQFSRDYDHRTVRVKKSTNRTWNDDVKMGDLERAILKSLAKSNPVVNVLLNFLGNIIYIIHSIGAFMKSSVVLTCISDYTLARGSEFMYMNI